MRMLWAAAAFALAISSAPAREVSPEEVDRLPASKPTVVAQYGSGVAHKGELRLPPGKGPFPVAIVIHGGCWTKGFATLRNTAPIATALTRKGIATWNIEYRQLGEDRAGWPGTFQDWGAAADHLRQLARLYPLDLKRVVAVGHSAGAHAALWLAARPKLPANSAVRGAQPLPLKAAVAIDGPGDLAPFIGFDRQVCGQPVITQLMGGTPAAHPDRYDQGTPLRQTPLGVPQYLVASQVLTPDAAAAYRSSATAKGDRVQVMQTAGSDHFNIIAPGEPQWAEIEAMILQAFR
jgi:acetyl esterase/lipase